MKVHITSLCHASVFQLFLCDRTMKYSSVSEGTQTTYCRGECMDIMYNCFHIKLSLKV